MQSVRSGSAITLSFLTLDGATPSVKPTNAIWSVVDQDGQIIVADQEIELPETAESINLEISAEINTLSGVGESFRTVTLRLLNAERQIATATQHYLVQARERLLVPRSSFQSYARAMMLASRIIGMGALFGAAIDDQESALFTAYQRITRLSFALPGSTNTRALFGPSGIIDPVFWHQADEPMFKRLSAHFRQCLCRAQVVEANQLLKGDLIAARRRSGLMAETIGESKMMFRPGMLAPDYGVSAETFRELAGYVYFQNRLGRV